MYLKSVCRMASCNPSAVPLPLDALDPMCSATERQDLVNAGFLLSCYAHDSDLWGQEKKHYPLTDWFLSHEIDRVISYHFNWWQRRTQIIPCSFLGIKWLIEHISVGCSLKYYMFVYRESYSDILYIQYYITFNSYSVFIFQTAVKLAKSWWNLQIINNYWFLPSVCLTCQQKCWQ